jgi:hypothetical protein
MADAFSASLSLFPAQEKKSENSPDHTGTIEISEAEIGNLVEYLQKAEREKNWKDEIVVKVRVAAWNSVAKGSGKAYLSGRVSPPLAQSPAPAELTF